MNANSSWDQLVESTTILTGTDLNYDVKLSYGTPLVTEFTILKIREYD
jgi:hypothetical protein